MLQCKFLFQLRRIFTIASYFRWMSMYVNENQKWTQDDFELSQSVPFASQLLLKTALTSRKYVNRQALRKALLDNLDSFLIKSWFRLQVSKKKKQLDRLILFSKINYDQLFHMKISVISWLILMWIWILFLSLQSTLHRGIIDRINVSTFVRE